MSPARYELVVITTIVCLGTLLLCTAIAYLKRYLSDRRFQATLAFYNAECYLDEEEHMVAATTRGFCNIGYRRLPLINGIAPREVRIEKHTECQHMAGKVEALLAEIRQKYERVTYLGKHTGQGRFNDVCLYSRIRHNGISRCTGEIASLCMIHGCQFLQIDLHKQDARVLEEAGWTLIQRSTPLNAILSAFSTTKQILLMMPRSEDELDGTIKLVLETAIRSIANVEMSA